MYDEIGKYFQSCLLCQQIKRPVHAKPSPLQPLPLACLFSHWHIYIYILSGLPTTKDKYKHILVVVDSYSKWMEAHSLRSQGATEVAAVLYREVITRYGAPRTLISDRGQTFMSKLTAAICELFQITRHYGLAYHPQSNSVVEKQILLYCKALVCIVKISRMTGQKSYRQSGWHIERCHEPGIAGLTSFPPVR